MDWTFEELAALQSEHDAEGAAQVADELREVGLTEYTAGRLPLHPEIAAAAAEADDPGIRWSGLAHPSVQASRAAINKAKKAKKAARPTGVTTLAAGESAIRRDFADDEVSGFERADYFRNHLTPHDLFTAENLQVVWDKTGGFQKGKSIDWKATRQVDEFVLLSPDMPAATRQAVIERGEAEALGRPMAWEARSLATSAERLAELAATTTSRSQLHRVAGNLRTPPDVLAQIYRLGDDFLDGALAANTALPASIAEAMVHHASIVVRRNLSCNIACPRDVLVALIPGLDEASVGAAEHHLELLSQDAEPAIDGIFLDYRPGRVSLDAEERLLLPRAKRESTWSYHFDKRLKRLVIHNISTMGDDEIDRTQHRSATS